jgi:hypothetical protein
VHAVCDLVCELDADLLEAGRLEPGEVLTLRERARDAADIGTTLGPSLPAEAVSATTSLTPTRPPGFSTRAISVSTTGLSVERLITQFEITTSTESAGNGICSMIRFRKCTFVTPASRAFRCASASISSVISSP